jgi:uncharacterized RDD family membrane protein YckC
MENFLTDFDKPRITYVGFLPRFAALIIDGLILSAAIIPISLLADEVPGPAITILTSFIPFLYNPIMEYRYGATVGKMAMRIKIVNTEHERLTINNVIFRNFIYFAIQLISVSTDLYKFYNQSENNFGGFTSMSDFFTPEIMISIIYGLVIIVIYTVELIFLLTDEKHRSLHDRIGKTYVVQK